MRHDRNAGSGHGRQPHADRSIQITSVIATGRAAWLPVVLVMLAGCVDSAAQREAQARAEGERQQINERLDALSRHLDQLSGDVGQIRDAVIEMHAAAQAQEQPAALPAPSAGSNLVVRLDGEEPRVGNRDAPIAIVEFSDYECPFCQRFFTQVYPRLKAEYIDTGKAQLVTLDFPLSFHGQAKSAAMAANCASQQGAYLPMRKGLVANLRQLDDALYVRLATELNLDLEQLANCMVDSATAAEVEADQQYGQSLGVRGTPTFLVGRLEGDRVVDARRIVGAQGFQVFASVLDTLASGSG